MQVHQSSSKGRSGSPKIFPLVRQIQRSLDRWASLTGIYHGVFHCWLNSRLVQNSYRQVKLKCRLPEGLGRILNFVEPCTHTGTYPCVCSLLLGLRKCLTRQLAEWRLPRAKREPPRHMLERCLHVFPLVINCKLATRQKTETWDMMNCKYTEPNGWNEINIYPISD